MGEITLKNKTLVYPDGLALSDKDIAFMNENTGAKFVKRTDKFLPTKQEKKEGKTLKIENKSLGFDKKFNLSGKFLKKKSLAISLSAFMVAVIMVIMALAQTIIAFDGSAIISGEMSKANQNSLFLNKIHDGQISEIDCFEPLSQDDIQAFYDAGYQGKIYKGITYTMPVTTTSILKGQNKSVFNSSIYITQTLATLTVDEDFLESKFGEVKYHVRRAIFVCVHN